MGNCCDQGYRDNDDSNDKLGFQGGNVHLVNTKDDWDTKVSNATKEGKIVVVNFSASWCGPCRVMTPHYAELSEKYPAICFLTIDVDELADFSASWDIRATPTFFFLKDGKQVDKLVGANKPELEKKIVAFSDALIR